MPNGVGDKPKAHKLVIICLDTYPAVTSTTVAMVSVVDALHDKYHLVTLTRATLIKAALVALYSL